MRLALALVVATIAVALSSAEAVVAVTSTRSPAHPGAFAANVFRLIVANRYAEAWQRLHPVHQTIVPVERYVECENLTPVRARVVTVRTVRVKAARIAVPGVSTRLGGVRVTLRASLVSNSVPTHFVMIKTIDLVQAADHWAWFLPPPRYAAYASGDCPQ